jgi:hypothetical protein
VAAALALCVTIVALGRGGLRQEPAVLLSKRQSTILAVSKGLQKLQISPKVSVLAARSLSQFHSLCKSPPSLATVTRSEMQRRRRRADSNWWNVIKAFKVFPTTPNSLCPSASLSGLTQNPQDHPWWELQKVRQHIFNFHGADLAFHLWTFAAAGCWQRRDKVAKRRVISHQTLFSADGRRGAERRHGRPKACSPAHLCGSRVVPLQPNADRGVAEEL